MLPSTENTENLALVKNQLQNKAWLIACLCAAWCDTCGAYRKQFDALANQHPDKCFAWIDIEDQANLVDEIDIENFPTILIQHHDDVVFFGTMLPDASQLHRLLNSFAENVKQEKISKRNSLNQDVPPGWSLRRRILEDR